MDEWTDGPIVRSQLLVGAAEKHNWCFSSTYFLLSTKGSIVVCKQIIAPSPLNNSKNCAFTFLATTYTCMLLVCLPGEIPFSFLWNREGNRKAMREERTSHYI